MRIIDRCRYFAAGEVLELSSGRSNEQPKALRVDGKDFDVSKVRRFLSKESAKMPTSLPGFLNWKILKWVGLNAAALAHPGPDPDGRMGDLAEEKIRSFKVGKFKVGELLLRQLERDIEIVRHKAKVEVEWADGTKETFERTVTDRRSSYYLQLVSAIVDVLSAACSTVPVFPAGLAVITPCAGIAALVAGYAWMRGDAPFMSTLLKMSAKYGAMIGVAEADFVGIPIAAAILAFDLGGAQRMLQAPTVADMNSLHKYVQKSGDA